MECSFARTEVLHDPVVSDNFVPNILIKEDQDMSRKYCCPLCSKTFPGPMRLKRRINNCKPVPTLDKKPFVPKVTITETIVIDGIDTEELNVSNSFIEPNVTSSTKTGFSSVDIDFGAAPTTSRTFDNQNDEEDFGNNDDIREENDKEEWENSVYIEESDTEETEKSPNLSPLQTKYSRHLWAGIPVQNVSYIPPAIDRTAVFNVQSKDRLSLLASCSDGRIWKHDSRSQWSGYKTVRYRDCAGSLICKNDTCIFKQNIGERNQIYWDVDGNCVHCHHLPEISTCFARKYIAFVSDMEADVYHDGEHTCREQLSKGF